MKLSVYLTISSYNDILSCFVAFKKRKLFSLLLLTGDIRPW